MFVSVKGGRKKNLVVKMLALYQSSEFGTGILSQQKLMTIHVNLPVKRLRLRG